MILGGLKKVDLMDSWVAASLAAAASFLAVIAAAADSLEAVALAIKEPHLDNW